MMYIPIHHFILYLINIGRCIMSADRFKRDGKLSFVLLHLGQTVTLAINYINRPCLY